jgi:hypothetical protein
MLAKHGFKLDFHVLRDLRDVGLVLGLPWLDDEQAFVQFGTTHVFTLMMGSTKVETQTEDRRPECLLMSSGKVQILMLKTRRRRGRNAEFKVSNVTLAAEQPAEFHHREKLTAEIREQFRSLRTPR